MLAVGRLVRIVKTIGDKVISKSRCEPLNACGFLIQNYLNCEVDYQQCDNEKYYDAN